MGRRRWVVERERERKRSAAVILASILTGGDLAERAWALFGAGVSRRLSSIPTRSSVVP